MDNRGQKRWRLWKSYMMIRELVTLRISGQRLLIIEYLDVAEQCLQTLEKIS
ncbi:hypothetical protein AtNW77_Chr3g0186681 [Arabidopsis thaliana]|uniref:E3 ubiquitin-protein ligase TRIP12-like TPR repeats domain-containing protein n=1 Tax=Arabidopsis thaliana TaxID=3702 RepID=A0A178VEL6_ARATH|nr:hypothetical protein AXX17_AT3G28930 [Arabidopsis thaliana]